MVRSVEAVLAVLAASAVTWWVAGDLSESAGEGRMLDLAWARENAVVIGLAGLVALVVCGRALLRSASTTSGAASTIGLAIGAGVILGLGLRVLTARTIGANIGGGGFMFVGLPVVAVLTILAIIGAALTGRSEQGERQ